MENYFDGFPIYKGLQKPLEFMGIRGKFLAYAAGSVALGFVTFLAVSFIADKLLGILAMIVVIGAGLGLIYLKQKDGLHSKKKYRGKVVYNSLFIKEY